MRVIDTHPELERSKFINDLNNYIIDILQQGKHIGGWHIDTI